MVDGVLNTTIFLTVFQGEYFSSVLFCLLVFFVSLVNFTDYNLEQGIADKFSNLGKIGFLWNELLIFCDFLAQMPKFAFWVAY